MQAMEWLQVEHADGLLQLGCVVDGVRYRIDIQRHAAALFINDEQAESASHTRWEGGFKFEPINGADVANLISRATVHAMTHGRLVKEWE